MGRKYDFEPRYLKNQLAHEGQWWLVLLDFSCSFIWAQLPLNPKFPFKLLDFRMAWSTAVLIAVTMKSAYLSKSLVDSSPEKSAEPSASSSVDSNTSRSVWSNLYLMWLVNVFLCGGGVSIEISMGRWSLPKSSPIWNCMACFAKFGEINAISRISVLLCYSVHMRVFIIYLFIIYLFKILKTIQSCTPYKRGAEVKRIHVYRIYLQKVPRNKRNLNRSTSKIIKW